MNREVRAFAEELWNSGRWDTFDSDRVLATVLFTDIVDSSDRLAELGDRAWRDLLERHHKSRPPRATTLSRHGGGYGRRRLLCALRRSRTRIRCASAIVAAVTELGLEVRAGLHTGECEVVDGKVAGIAVHTGARVASQAGAGEVLVSSTVKDLVAGSGIAFSDRGVRELKGVPGQWQLYAVDRVTA